MQIQIPPLNDGETYLCGIVDANGDVEHTVIVAFNSEELSWEKQMEWANSLNADLMTRPEQAIAFAAMPDRFEKDWYWSKEKYGSACAWYTDFDDGYQDYGDRSYRLRAVAVRRFKN